MEKHEFHYRSRRAALARLSASLAGPLATGILFVSGPASLIAGLVLLIFASQPFGWLLVGVAAGAANIFLWQRLYLSQLPVGDSASGIEQRLVQDVLAHLPLSLAPDTLAAAVMRTRGGQFMAVRLGIGPSFLALIAGNDPTRLSDIWQQAASLADARGDSQINGADVTAAIVVTSPLSGSLLPQLQLQGADVMAGANWYGHLVRLIAESGRRYKTGGIARDWTFGYTPLLERYGVNITNRVVSGGSLHVKVDAHQEAIDRLLAMLAGGGRQASVLVGRAGSGKTSVVNALAERLMHDQVLPRGLKFRQIISLDAATLVSRASGRGELEGLVNALLVEAYTAKNIILCLDDAQFFFEEGVGSVDIGSILEPVATGGVLPIILTMDEQRWLGISRRYPTLAGAVNRINISETNHDETLRVVQDQVVVLEHGHRVTYMLQALREATALAERYIHEQSNPGKTLQLLAAAADFSDNGVVTTQSVRLAIEKTYDVRVAGTATASEKESLLKLEEQIHRRMVSQDRAVTVVSDALRRAQAGIRNQERPVGTFLFLGPTGVGKTELAKALAEVYFKGEDNLIRIDMNEFVGPQDVQRLLADGADDPHSLTAQVAKRPFSVVLLDELEKAHPNVLNALLQMLDEGILRDISNRPVSFRDAIVIATSNAGVKEIQQAMAENVEQSTIEDRIVHQLIANGTFRPEFVNRFDEVVVFRALQLGELMQVVDKILAGINAALASQQISVSVDDAAKRWLVEKGNDPALGARPMRRIVQRTVESLIAKRMLAGGVGPGSTIVLTLADIEQAP